MRDTLHIMGKQACTGGIWFRCSVTEQAARSRRVCPLQQRVSSDTRKEVADILRNKKSGTTGISLVFYEK